VKSIFDLEFSSNLVEIHKKPYNISLGISLSDYPLIKHLISILRLSSQFQNGSVDTETLTKVVTSPYIKGAMIELNNRALLTNKIRQLSATRIKTNKILSLCDGCPSLKEIFIKLNDANLTKKITLELSLDSMNSFLLIWGFTSDRNLSSSEYQIYEKYQVESLVLNKLSDFHQLTTLDDALKILIEHMNAVIFQPQSGSANIYILGSLEAEGLFFDFAWVSSMTSSFLPGKIKMPLFIPPKTSVEYCLPGTSFELITKESEITLNNLQNLSKNLTFSYSTYSDSREQIATPYLLFEDPQQIEDPQVTPREMELIEDFIAPKIKNLEIKKGVKTLQDQMGCEFKGFINRLNFQEINDSVIGISKLEQGNIIHNILERFFNEVSSSSELKELSETRLDELIETHSENALQEIPQSNFRINEKVRVKKVIKQYIDLEKNREFFEVVGTESEAQVDIAGLKFSTRIDRMDRLKDGSKLIIDYKTGKNIGISKLINQPLEQAQLPIYAISNEVDGVAFATINSQDSKFKAITKNKNDLPMSSQSINRMPEWKKQVSDWKDELVQASQKFQNGHAEVLPSSHACDFCDYDLLCRVDKSGND
jgi:probable DNA repair protein